MQERYYHILRHIFFWLFSFLFIIFMPVIVYYSLGYKFDTKTKKFLKTGAISIKTFPRGISVSIDGKKISEATPCTLRDLMPREYKLTLEKEGFYTYTIIVEVRPSLIQDIDVFLIPKMGDIKKLELDLHIYKFFVTKHLFGERIMAFTDKGIYLLDDDFKEVKKLSTQIFAADEANSIENLEENNNRIIFWNRTNIWMLTPPQETGEALSDVTNIYRADKDIKDIFFGFKGKYLIIHDGLKVIALDIENFKISFPVYELKSLNSRIFYNSAAETLYIKDKIPKTNYFSLFKIEMMPLINERLSDEGKKD